MCVPPQLPGSWILFSISDFAILNKILFSFFTFFPLFSPLDQQTARSEMPVFDDLLYPVGVKLAKTAREEGEC